MKKRMLHEEVSWEEFLERYLIHHEEFVFYYNNKEVNICWGENGLFSYNVTSGNKKLLEESFVTPQELLRNARFDGKLLEEIWCMI